MSRPKWNPQVTELKQAIYDPKDALEMLSGGLEGFQKGRTNDITGELFAQTLAKYQQESQQADPSLTLQMGAAPAPTSAPQGAGGLDPRIVAAAEAEGVDPRILDSVWAQESGRSTDTSMRGQTLPKGKWAGHVAQGPMQIMTFHEDFNPEAPLEEHFRWAARHLKDRGVRGYYGEGTPVVGGHPSTDQYEQQVLERAGLTGEGAAPTGGTSQQAPGPSQTFTQTPFNSILNSRAAQEAVATAAQRNVNPAGLIEMFKEFDATNATNAQTADDLKSSMYDRAHTAQQTAWHGPQAQARILANEESVRTSQLTREKLGIELNRSRLELGDEQALREYEKDFGINRSRYVEENLQTRIQELAEERNIDPNEINEFDVRSVLRDEYLEGPGREEYYAFAETVSPEILAKTEIGKENERAKDAAVAALTKKAELSHAAELQRIKQQGRKRPYVIRTENGESSITSNSGDIQDINKRNKASSVEGALDIRFERLFRNDKNKADKERLAKVISSIASKNNVDSSILLDVVEDEMSSIEFNPGGLNPFSGVYDFKSLIASLTERAEAESGSGRQDSEDILREYAQ